MKKGTAAPRADAKRARQYAVRGGSAHSVFRMARQTDPPLDGRVHATPARCRPRSGRGGQQRRVVCRRSSAGPASEMGLCLRQSIGRSHGQCHKKKSVNQNSPHNQTERDTNVLLRKAQGGAADRGRAGAPAVERRLAVYYAGSETLNLGDVASKTSGASSRVW